MRQVKQFSCSGPASLPSCMMALHICIINKSLPVTESQGLTALLTRDRMDAGAQPQNKWWQQNIEAGLDLDIAGCAAKCCRGQIVIVKRCCWWHCQPRPVSTCKHSQGQAKDCGDAVHCLVLPAHCATAVGGIVPIAGGSCVQASACRTGNGLLALQTWMLHVW